MRVRVMGVFFFVVAFVFVLYNSPNLYNFDQCFNLLICLNNTRTLYRKKGLTIFLAFKMRGLKCRKVVKINIMGVIRLFCLIRKPKNVTLCHDERCLIIITLKKKVETLSWFLQTQVHTNMTRVHTYTTQVHTYTTQVHTYTCINNV